MSKFDHYVSEYRQGVQAYLEDAVARHEFAKTKVFAFATDELAKSELLSRNGIVVWINDEVCFLRRGSSNVVIDVDGSTLRIFDDADHAVGSAIALYDDKYNFIPDFEEQFSSILLLELGRHKLLES